MELVRMKNTPSRVGFLDDARGVCILLMVLYHGAYDIAVVFGQNLPFFHWPVMRLVQQLIAGTFILISGVCCRYSRGNFRRGLMVLGVALAMTLFTLLFMREQRILFGVLHFLGCAMILFALCRGTLDRLPVFAGTVAMMMLFIITYPVQNGWLGIPGLLGTALPAPLYGTGFLFPLGFPGPGFFSSDYFPLMPWIFCFMAGSYLGVAFTQGDVPHSLYRSRSPLLAWIGRRSLVIYLLHQPVIYGLLSVFFYFYYRV